MPADGNTSIATQRQTLKAVRGEVAKALAAYRSVRFSVKTGVRAYFEAKEAARADVLAAVHDAREAS